MEQKLLTKDEVFLYNIPLNNRKGTKYVHRAKDWDFSNPIGSYKLNIVSAGNSCRIRFSTYKGGLFGESLIHCYPTGSGSGLGSCATLHSVEDSTRYFTLNVRKSSGKYELLGLGFTARSDSTDLTETLSKYFASQNQKVKVSKTVSNPLPIPKAEDEDEPRFKNENRWRESDSDIDDEPKPEPNHGKSKRSKREENSNWNWKVAEAKEKNRSAKQKERETEKRKLQLKLQQIEFQIEQKIAQERKRIENLYKLEESGSGDGDGKRLWKHEKSTLKR